MSKILIDHAKSGWMVVLNKKRTFLYRRHLIFKASNHLSLYLHVTLLGCARLVNRFWLDNDNEKTDMTIFIPYDGTFEW